MTRDKFLQLLFEPGELTCFAQTPYDTALASQPAENSLFFSINPMHTSRADAHVTAYRNFLLELDNVPLKEQIEYVCSKLPVSAITFSGNKSYHFIVSLVEPLQTEAEYRRVWRGLYEAVPSADKTTKNPSRLSRLPGVVRPDTGLLQELVYVGNRVPLSELPKPSPIRESHEQPTRAYVTTQLLRVLDVGVDTYVQAHFSGRNQFFYWLGKRLSELGHTREQKKQMVDKFYERLQNKRNFTKSEAYAAARVRF